MFYFNSFVCLFPHLFFIHVKLTLHPNLRWSAVPPPTKGRSDKHIRGQ